MTDFLDTLRPAPRPLARITCDADGCTARLDLERDVNQTESVELAKQHGWSAYLGARAYHWCDRHKEGT